MYTATVSTKGWVVIPKELREKHGLKEGARVRVVEYGDLIILVPIPDDPVAALHGLLEGGPSMTADLLAEHALEHTKEESRRD